MPIIDQLDNQAPDFRNLEPPSNAVVTVPVQAEAPLAVADQQAGRRNVTIAEILLIIGILLGVLGLVYFLLENEPSRVSLPPRYPLSPANSQNAKR